jgi:hypothetical protein
MYVVYTYISDEREVFSGKGKFKRLRFKRRIQEEEKKQILAGEWQMRRTQTN